MAELSSLHLFDSLSLGLVVIKNNKVSWCNQQAALILQKKKKGIIGKSPEYLLQPFKNETKALLAGRVKKQEVSFDNKKFIDISISKDNNAAVLVLQDVSSQIIAKQLHKNSLAFHDSLEKELFFLVNASRTLIQTIGKEDTHRAIIDIARTMVAADGYALWEKKHDAWRLEASYGLSSGFKRAIEFSIHEQQGMENKLMIFPDVYSSPLLKKRKRAHENEKIKSLLALPLKIQGVDVGRIGFYFKRKTMITDSQIQGAITLANLAASALYSLKQFNSQKELASEAHNAYEKLKVSEEKYRTLIDTAPDVIYSVSLKDGAILELSPAFEKILGFKREMFLGKNFLSLVLSDDKKKALEYFSEHKKGIKTKPFELRFVTKNGEIRTGELRSTPQKGGRIMGIARDITDRKQEEEYRDYFVGVASHELKTPLTSIKAFAEVLERKNKDTLDERSREYLKKIHEKIDTQTKLINELLDITRIKSGKLEFLPERIDIDQLVDRVVEDMQYVTPTHLIVKKNSLPCRVFADKTRIIQVLINLLSNAVKYSPEGKRIEVSLEDEGDLVVIAVKDRGIGIAKEDKGQIFLPYFQASRHKKKLSLGLGVGLYISSEIIKQHGGLIKVKSVVGKGSTFFVLLPKLARKKRLEKGLLVSP